MAYVVPEPLEIGHRQVHWGFHEGVVRSVSKHIETSASGGGTNTIRISSHTVIVVNVYAQKNNGTEFHFAVQFDLPICEGQFVSIVNTVVGSRYMNTLAVNHSLNRYWYLASEVHLLNRLKILRSPFRFVWPFAAVAWVLDAIASEFDLGPSVTLCLFSLWVPCIAGDTSVSAPPAELSGRLSTTLPQSALPRGVSRFRTRGKPLRPEQTVETCS